MLKPGERKAIKTDRTILVPGPKREVACIRAMFDLAAGRKERSVEGIAKELNRRHMFRSDGKVWVEIFGVTPLLGDAANATDLADLFKTFP